MIKGIANINGIPELEWNEVQPHSHLQCVNFHLCSFAFLVASWKRINTEYEKISQIVITRNYFFKGIMTQVFYVTAYQSLSGSLEYLECPVDVDKTTIITKMLKFILYVKSDDYIFPCINGQHYYFIYLYTNKYISHFQFYICDKN